MLTIVGLPLGVAIINKIPWIVAPRKPSQANVKPLQTKPVVTTTVVTTVTRDGTTNVTTVVTPEATSQPKQRSFLVRAIWFVFVGWWASAIWMLIAWMACETLFGMPLGFWMFDKTPAVLSLRR